MVDDHAVQRFGGAGKARGRSAIAVAGPRIAARMIVSQSDAGAPVKRRVAHDLAQREIGTVLVAGMTRQVDAPRMVVQMRDPKALPLLRFIEAAGEEVLRGEEAVELQREFGTLVTHDNELRDP